MNIGIFGLVAAISCGSALAQTLEEALSQAYISNPVLFAARASLRAVDEGVPQAQALGRPTAAATGTAGPTWTKGGIIGTAAPSAVASGVPDKVVRTNPRTVGLTVTQQIYRGGLVDASISQAENAVQAQRASLLDTEQTMMLQAVTAYLDVFQGEALVNLQVNFEKFQKRDLEAFRDRFRVGEITQTDVSLQEAQVASAAAARISAEGTLAVARASYTRLMGVAPEKTEQPHFKYALPPTLEEAILQAQANNPKVVTAKFSESAARDGIDVADSGLLPTFGVTASVAHNLDRSRPDDFANSAGVIANLTIPLDNGGVAAKARAARHSANAARINIEQSLRTVRDLTVTAWQNLATARASIVSYQVAVKANGLAAEGMRQQVAVGASTVIDLLNTEQTLLNARLNLVKAQHDENAASFAALAAIGQLSAQNLKLPVAYYDYEAHYNTVRDKWFGNGIDE
ncbi:MAG: TolC family outer membrane protein [Rhodospirillaceae bacterium]